MAMNRTQLEERGPGSSSGLRETRALRLTGSNQAVESTAEHLHAQRGNYHGTTKSQPKEATFAKLQGKEKEEAMLLRGRDIGVGGTALLSHKDCSFVPLFS